MTIGLPELIALLIGSGGLAGTVTSIVQARRAVKAGARTDERAVIDATERWRQSADDARIRTERLLEKRTRDLYWYREQNAVLRYRCIAAGVSITDLPTDPPAE